MRGCVQKLHVLWCQRACFVLRKVTLIILHILIILDGVEKLQTGPGRGRLLRAVADAGDRARALDGLVLLLRVLISAEIVGHLQVDVIYYLLLLLVRQVHVLLVSVGEPEEYSGDRLHIFAL
jgi:hypothetical protein